MEIIQTTFKGDESKDLRALFKLSGRQFAKIKMGKLDKALNGQTNIYSDGKGHGPIMNQLQANKNPNYLQ